MKLRSKLNELIKNESFSLNKLLCSNMKPSKLGKITFALSDFVSGAILCVSVLGLLLSFIVPLFSYVVMAFLPSYEGGVWGLIYLLLFVFLTYLTFRHHRVSIVGHLLLLVAPAILGYKFSFVYLAIVIVYLVPYIVVYRDIVEHNKSLKSDAASGAA